MKCGHGESRCLLESCLREQHAAREFAELGDRAGAQARLADNGRDEVGGVPRRAQPGDLAGHVVSRGDRREGVEQAEPLGG